MLGKLSAQNANFSYEILVVDSGSVDGTIERARRYGATVHQIPGAEFNHGETRNLGISLSRGEYVALLVQDAVPLDERWLAAMVEDLDRDGRAAGVYGRQIPHPESSVLTRALVNSWTTAGLERREQFTDDPENYSELPPTRRRTLATFDNVSSCVRRSVWEEISFERTNFGEDLRWGKRVVEAGFKIVYEPRSAVFHSHERGAMYDLRRHYVDQLVLLDLFGLALAPSLMLLILGTLRSSAYLYRLLRKEERATREAPRLMLLALKYSVCARTGAYLGIKSRRLARISPRASAGLDRFLSKGI